MGLFRVLGKITGATYLTLPADVAQRLGLRTLRDQVIVTAGGRREVWPVPRSSVRPPSRAFRWASIQSRGVSFPSMAS